MPVQLQSTVVDAGDRVVAAETRTLEVGQFVNNRAADCYVVLPLTTLAPGDYLLKVEAKMGHRAAGRAMRFVVKK